MSQFPPAIQKQVDSGAVPNHVSNVCPSGTKFHVLVVGWLECDEGFVVRGGNTSVKSKEKETFVNKRRELPMYVLWPISRQPTHERQTDSVSTGTAFSSSIPMKASSSGRRAAERITLKSGAQSSATSSPEFATSPSTNFERQSKQQGIRLRTLRRLLLDTCTSIMREVWTSFSTVRTSRSGCMTES